MGPQVTKRTPIYLLFLLCHCATTQEFDAWITRGDKFFARDLYREALESYQQASIAAPDSAKLRYRLGLVFLKVGNYSAAKSHLEAVATDYDGNYSYHFFLGEVYRVLERHDMAIFQYQRALQAKKTATAMRSLAWSYYQIRFYKAALTAARKAYRLDAKDDQAAIIYLRTLIKLSNLKKAYTIIRKRNWGDDYHHYVLALQGELFAQKKRYRKAARYFSRALKVQPLLPSALFGLARIKLLNRKRQTAIRLFERGLRVRPQQTEVYYELARAYEDVDSKAARKYYRLFYDKARLDPEFVSRVDMVRKKLSLLR